MGAAGYNTHCSAAPLPPMPSNAPAPRRDWALFLDFDGTLVDFAPTPDRVRPDPDLVPTLGRAAEALGRALAVVTGRRIVEIDRWLGASVAAVAGGHGIERRDAEGRTTNAANPPPPGDLERARARLAAVADAHEGVYLEDKGYGLVLHFRAAPERREECVQALNALANPALEVLQGAAVAELRACGVHKGTAIAAFMDEAPFAGRTPVFVGDDVTDEDGFRAVNAMGGISILAGPERRSSARHRLPDVASVLAWLRRFPARAASETAVSA